MSRRRRTRSVGVALASICVAGASAASAALTDGGPGEGPFFWVRWAGALGLCMLLAIAGAYAIKLRQSRALDKPRFAFPAWARPLRMTGGRRLRLIENLRISPQLEVSLLECDDRELLLATTSQGAVLLKEGPKTAP